MGPFSSELFLVKTFKYDGSKPSTPTNIKIPFNFLSKSLQGMRRAGFNVSTITQAHNTNKTKRTHQTNSVASDSKPSNREVESIKLKERGLKSGSKRERKTSNRRGRKKS